MKTKNNTELIDVCWTIILASFCGEKIKGGEGGFLRKHFGRIARFWPID